MRSDCQAATAAAAAALEEEEMAATQPGPGRGLAENKGGLGADGALGVGAVEEKGRDGLQFPLPPLPRGLN